MKGCQPNLVFHHGVLSLKRLLTAIDPWQRILVAFEHREIQLVEMRDASSTYGAPLHHGTRRWGSYYVHDVWHPSRGCLRFVYSPAWTREQTIDHQKSDVDDCVAVEFGNRRMVGLLQTCDGEVMCSLLVVDVADGAGKYINLIVEFEPVELHLLQHGIQLLANGIRTVTFQHSWRGSGCL